MIVAGAYFRRGNQRNRFDTGETERFEFHGVIENRYEQWITKIQSHRVSWSIKSARWSSVRVGYQTSCAQKELVLGKQIGQFRSLETGVVRKVTGRLIRLPASVDRREFA